MNDNTFSCSHFSNSHKAVQNMKDRLRHDESSSEISMNSEKMHMSICRQHCTWTRVTKKVWNYSRILNLRTSNSEIKNVFSADVASSLWEKPVLLKEQATKWMKAKVYVYSDSVLCLGKNARSIRCNKKVE